MLDSFVRVARRLAPALCIGLLAAAPHEAALHVGFSSPAGLRPAGPLAAPFAAVLPSGRLLDPLGTNVEAGGYALGFAITPDGRWAVVSTAASPSGGDLVVVDLRKMRVASRFHGPTPFFAGVTTLRDPAARRRTLVLASAGAANLVYLFDLDGRGVLTADAKPAIAIAPPLDERLANFGWAVPSTIVPSRDGRRAFVVGVGAATVTTLDLLSRSVQGTPAPVGFAPFAAALASGTLLVANEGVMAPGVLAAPAQQPTFDVPAFAEGRASSLSLLPLQSDGTAGPQSSVVQMDGAPDGVQIVGGAHPSAVAVSPDGRYAYVAMAGVDRVATVALSRMGGRVVGGTELRLYDRGPYGTQPDAMVASHDGRRLYVALAGIDAVAVLDAHDPRRLHRLGLLPTGWQPVAMSLSRDGRRLFVLSARGAVTVGGPAATFERIDLARVSLASVTRRALATQRSIQPLRSDPLVPAVFDGKPSDGIKHVVLVLAGNRTFDAMLGDAGEGDAKFAAVAEPSLLRFGAATTPNLHALVRRYGVAGNLYNDADTPVTGDGMTLGGIENPFESRMRAAGILDADSDGIAPDAYPRLGYLFNSLAARHIEFRDYGVLLRVPRAAAGRYSLDVPALAALAGHIDANYRVDDSRTTNAARAAEFVRDYAATATVGKSSAPDFVGIRLPSVVAGKSDADALADQDRALGTIVEFLSKQTEWPSTVIFVVPEAVVDSRDHVDPHRSYALVVSPFAKRAYLGMLHLSTASVLKTEEEILGLPALSLADALSSDMSDFFTPSADAAPFAALASASQPGKRVVASGGE